MFGIQIEASHFEIGRMKEIHAIGDVVGKAQRLIGVNHNVVSATANMQHVVEWAVGHVKT